MTIYTKKIRYCFNQFVLVALVIFFCHASTYAQISLNEICASNSNVYTDEFNETPDWIELHNYSNETVQLKGWHLTDDADNLEKWTFPIISIPPNGFYLILADDEDILFQYPHTNFKLSSGGEHIILTNELGSIVDEITFPPLDSNTSFGRTENNQTDWIDMSIPTPLKSNSEIPFTGTSLPVSCLTENRHNLNPVNIVLECPENNCEIYYTLDGRMPNRETAALYNSPFELNKTAVVRAISITPNHLPSLVQNFSFFIGDDHSLPIIHLTTRPDNLWDWETGILVRGPNADPEWPYFGANYWRDVTIPVFLEYYNENKMLAFSHQMDSKVHGGRGARTQWQKPLRLLAKNKYGSDTVNFKFFKDREREIYKRIVLRNASGDYNNCHFRDAFLARYFIGENLNVDVLAYQPVVIYLNGEYYGVINMREKSDEFYLKNNFQVDIDNLDLLEEDTLIALGDFEIFDEMYDFMVSNDLSIDANYEIAKSYFDIENITDTYIVQTGLNNNDWLGNNIKYWREKTPDAKWRYLLFDMDIAMGRHSWTKFDYDLFKEKMEIYNGQNRHINIFQALLANQQFKEYFLSRYADLFNTSFQSDIFQKELNRTVNLLEPEMQRHLENWPGYSFDSWKFDRIPVVEEHIEERPYFARKYLIDYFNLEKEVELTINTYPDGAGKIKVNTIEPTELPWTGFYFDGIPVTLSIEENPGFIFSHWKSNNTILSKDPDQEIKYNFSDNDDIIAYFEDDENKFNVNQVFLNENGNLNLNLELGTPQLLNFIVYDQLGRFIHRFPDLLVGGGIQQLELNLPTIPNGIYFISILHQEQETVIKFPVIK